MTSTIESIRAEYLRYKALAEAAIAQVEDADLSKRSSGADNSIAIICWHVSGNLESRFTDFLTSDGEKPWRNREEEFQPRTATRAELLAKWNRGWEVVVQSLSDLKDEDLQLYRDHSTAIATDQRSAPSFIGTPCVSCRPDRLHRKALAGKRLALPVNSTRPIGCLQSSSSIRSSIHSRAEACRSE